MSGCTSAPRVLRPPTAAVERGGGSARAWGRALWARLVSMRRAAETRRVLGALDPRLLADIGVTRAEAQREAERWPWDLEPTRHPGRGTGAHW
jgi:uncharacterized protein YjiS (DUF1127 family)